MNKIQLQILIAIFFVFIYTIIILNLYVDAVDKKDLNAYFSNEYENVENKIPSYKLNKQHKLLPVGFILKRGKMVKSPNAKYTLKMQKDGNLVLYHGKIPKWTSATVNSGANHFVVRKDGNLVLYKKMSKSIWATNTAKSGATRFIASKDGNLVLYDRKYHPVWTSNTKGMHGAKLKLLNNGNLILYHNGNSVWETNTVLNSQSTPLDPFTKNIRLKKGQSLYSKNREFRLTLQRNGDLVLYQIYNQKIWSSRTQGHPGVRLALQNDGNLVLYHASNVIWSTGTRVAAKTDAHLSERNYSVNDSRNSY